MALLLLRRCARQAHTIRPHADRPTTAMPTKAGDTIYAPHTPLQAVLRKRPRSELTTRDPDAPPEFDLQDGARCLFVGSNHYGCVAVVLPAPGPPVAKAAEGAAPAAGAGPRRSYVIRVQPVSAAGSAEAYAKRAKGIVARYQVCAPPGLKNPGASRAPHVHSSCPASCIASASPRSAIRMHSNRPLCVVPRRTRTTHPGTRPP